MQTFQDHRERFFKVWTGKGAGNGPVASEMREGLFGDVGKHCYVKYECRVDSEEEAASWLWPANHNSLQGGYGLDAVLEDVGIR